MLVEARDRIGGRTFTAQVDNQQFELGGAWIRWRQPHIWTEVTRYGLSLAESEGGVPDYISVLLDNGSRIKTVALSDLHPKLSEILDKFSDIDGFQGKTIFPLPHAPLTALEAIEAYDHLTMYDRLHQISSLFEGDEEMPSIIDAYMSVNSQGEVLVLTMLLIFEMFKQLNVNYRNFYPIAKSNMYWGMIGVVIHTSKARGHGINLDKYHPILLLFKNRSHPYSLLAVTQRAAGEVVLMAHSKVVSLPLIKFNNILTNNCLKIDCFLHIFMLLFIVFSTIIFNRDMIEICEGIKLK